MRRPVTGLSRSRERGAIAVVVAIVIFVLLAFLVLVMNVGHGYSVRAELQSAGDSAALAGVRDIGRSDLVPPSTDWTGGDQTTSLTTARNTALTYAGLHTTDGTVSVSNPVVRLGIWHSEYPTPSFEYVPAPSGNTVFQINAVQVNAARNADQTGGPLTVFGSGLLGSSTINVVTSATAARFAPCKIASAAPMVFTQDQIDGLLPCEAETPPPLPMSQIMFTMYRQNRAVTAASIQGLLMRPGGPRNPPRCDPNWASKQGPLPTAPASVNVRNGGDFGFGGGGRGGRRGRESEATRVLSSLACLVPPSGGSQMVDVGIVDGSAPTSETHSVTTWARITIVSVNSFARTITIRRECGESEQDATAGVAGRCRAVGLLSTRPVLMQ